MAQKTKEADPATLADIVDSRADQVTELLNIPGFEGTDLMVAKMSNGLSILCSKSQNFSVGDKVLVMSVCCPNNKYGSCHVLKKA